jgi:hypothetical protein
VGGVEVETMKRLKDTSFGMSDHCVGIGRRRRAMNGHRCWRG